MLEGDQLASVSASLGSAAALVKKLRAVEPGVALPGGGEVSLLPALFEGVGVQAALKLAIGSHLYLYRVNPRCACVVCVCVFVCGVCVCVCVCVCVFVFA